MTFLNKTLLYIKTGYLLHMVTAGEIAFLYLLLHTCKLGAWVLERDTALRFLILLPLLWSPLFPQLDARSRFQNYKMLKDYFYLYGFDARLVKYFAKSRCQRDAVLAAADETGFGAECRAYFFSCGYRWHHLFPDIIFEKPVVLLSWAFYQNTFFAKTYHSKIKPGMANVRPAKTRDTHVKAA